MRFTPRLNCAMTRLRLLGMGISNLSDRTAIQQKLFDRTAEEKSRRLDQTTDKIKDRFGDIAVRRATSLEFDIRHRPDPSVGLD